MRVLWVLVVTAVVIWALIEAIQADKREIRRLPKALWVVVIIFVPFGAVAWFLFGRPKVPVNTPRSGQPNGVRPRPGRPAPAERPPRPAPDDDPEFLRRLSQQAEQAKMLRLREEGRAAEDPGKPAKPTDPRPDDAGPDNPDTPRPNA